MEFEFDKEMDALLRQAAQGETVSAHSESNVENSKPLHLDADEISLFAENALSEKTKALYIEHLADCERCRKILANVVSFNSETVAEIFAAPQKAVVAPVVPWYKRLFAAPNLAYAMGALLLAFAGLIGFTVLQSSGDSQNAEVAVVESTPKMSGPNAGGSGGLQTGESNAAATSNGGAMQSNSATANAAISNSAMSSGSMSNGASAMSNMSAAASLPAVLPNAGAGSNTTAAFSNSASAANSATTLNKQLDKKAEATQNEIPRPSVSAVPAKQSDDFDSTGNVAAFADEQKAKSQEMERLRDAADDKAMQTPAQKPASPAAQRSAPAEPPVSGRATSRLGGVRAKKSPSTESRQIGGKTFRRENGAWYDADYKGQTTTNVARGSSDFKKLDAGLRAVAESLSGAVVVVYNGRAYRIQ